METLKTHPIEKKENHLTHPPRLLILMASQPAPPPPQGSKAS